MIRATLVLAAALLSSASATAETTPARPAPAPVQAPSPTPTPAPTPGASPAPTADFSVERGALKLQAGLNLGTAGFDLKLTGDLAKQSCQLALAPSNVPDPPHIDLTLTADAGWATPTGRTWRVTVDVKAMPTVTQPATRYFKATYCGHTQGLEFSLDNSIAGDFAWSVTSLKPQRWDGRRPLPINVFVGARPATGVQLMAPQLVAKDARVVEPAFLLCSTRSNACDGKSLNLAANRMHDLWVRRATDAIVPDAGEYTGTLRLVADQKPAGDSFDVTFYVSDTTRQVIGGVLILVGVLLSFVVVRWLRQSAERKALLRPVRLLEEQITGLEAAVEGVKQQIGLEFTHLEPAIERARTALQDIDRFLPPVLQFWAAPPDLVPPQGGYQAFLTAGANTVGSLTIIFQQGIQQALLEARQGRPQAELDIVEAAIGRLDALATQDLTKRDDIANAVRAILSDMTGKLNAEADKNGRAADTVSPGIAYSSEALSFQLVLLNVAGWSLFTLLTALVGIYVLVINNPSFGKPEDLLLCLLWGFGLPLAGEGLTKLTPTGISQSLGMTVTRTQP